MSITNKNTIIFPLLTIYTDNLPANFAGTAQAFVVKIRPKYKDDKGLHEHEYTHVKQWYKWLFLWLLFTALLVLGTYEHLGLTLAPLAIAGVGVHGLLYLLVPSYKFHAEAEAYAVQVKNGADIDKMAYHLATWYGLGITQAEAKEKIQEYL